MVGTAAGPSMRGVFSVRATAPVKSAPAGISLVGSVHATTPEPSKRSIPREVAPDGVLIEEGAAGNGGVGDPEVGGASSSSNGNGEVDYASNPATAATAEEAMGSGGGVDEEEEEEEVEMQLPKAQTQSVVQAAAEGAINAVPLAACIAATVIAFLALISLLDSMVGTMGSLVGINEANGLQRLSFTRILGWIASPIAVLMGIPPHDCAFIGELLGIKTASNEFVAYARLGAAAHAGSVSRRATVVATYALCGFANFGSMGMMVGALSTMAPHKRDVLSAEVLRALIAGTLACFATACIASMLFDEVLEARGGDVSLNFTAACHPNGWR